jgi:purine/pyrimidine-nucleoside phosphorylase
VKSIGFQDREGLLTSAVIESGEVQFSTSSKEHVIGITGSLTIRRPGDDAWMTVLRAESFDVPTHVSFRVNDDEPTAYLCRYSGGT